MENLDTMNIETDKKYCKRCHRELKDEKSKELGYGKICYRKIQTNKQNYLFDLEVTDEVIIKNKI